MMGNKTCCPHCKSSKHIHYHPDGEAECSFCSWYGRTSGLMDEAEKLVDRIAQRVIDDGREYAGRYAWHYVGEENVKEFVVDALTVFAKLHKTEGEAE